ncbi:MAG: hypothetical protein KF841_08280 [Phycisphaerae bacterium]|nr:hypothetical protein [Phycisphaerae bacterium]
MLNRSIVVLIASVITACAAEKSAAGTVVEGLEVGHPIIALHLRPAEGGDPLSVDSFRERKLLIVHFAPWHAQSVETLETWISATKKLRASKKIALVAIMHEQRAERAAIFARWKKYGIPLLHDPYNFSSVDSLPTVVAVDEMGFVRLINPVPETIEREFVKKKFKAGKYEARAPELEPPNHRALKRMAAESRDESIERQLGDALVIAGSSVELDEGLRTYSRILQKNPKDSVAFFRLGVGLLARSESGEAEESDRDSALESLRNAAKLSPGNIVFQARLAEYDRKSAKPMSGVDFDGWLKRAGGTEETGRTDETP